MSHPFLKGPDDGPLSVNPRAQPYADRLQVITDMAESGRQGWGQEFDGLVEDIVAVSRRPGWTTVGTPFERRNEHDAAVYWLCYSLNAAGSIGNGGGHEDTLEWGLGRLLSTIQLIQDKGQRGVRSERRLYEDPSGYTTAFTHPDPLDPNDAQRQRTQSRSKGLPGGKGTGYQGYPYDQPTSYGRSLGVGDGGAAYQDDGDDQGPPTPRNARAKDWRPKSAWNILAQNEDLLRESDDPAAVVDVLIDQVEQTGRLNDSLWQEFSRAIWGSLRGYDQQRVIKSTSIMDNPRAKSYIDWEANNAWVGNSASAIRGSIHRMLDMILNNRQVSHNGEVFEGPELASMGLTIISKLLKRFGRAVLSHTVKESALGTYSPGEQSGDAEMFGYGQHDRIGEDSLSPERMAIDLLSMFGMDRDVCDEPEPPDLLAILSGDGDLGGGPTYDDDTVYAPGAEYDAGVVVDDGEDD